ncbi:MAG: hypothetical protein HOG89_03875 [Candidatus Peribacter sp.]|jgi:hypothetical protein|nr:hypothetical protein [Candidatus Peribacter sp.]MBT4393106.1 hypothetical protein [Candidatus Peribacter sp.]MBT4600905.1 hypothetical protein [Candidatus Peribacter sp.]MBT5148965.1 hypothetical protein [Candidatus Peribacter sp.]MBT5638356.1 hypothetical protein [Candidatus Peribacter sp.]
MQRLLSITLALIFLSSPALVGAADPIASTDACRLRTNRELAREQRLYRVYLFGKKKAEDAEIGNVRYDRDGWAWIKKDDSGTPWRNSHPDHQSLKWSDGVMDANDEHSEIIPIIGIFETKRVMTSELIPYLLQSIRALECRTAALCEASRFSEIQGGNDPVDVGEVQPVGCIEFKDLQTWPECHFAQPEPGIKSQADSRSYCDDISNQLLRRETEQLKLAVEYDAGFRTLLQFAGNFDIFLRELRWPLTGTLRQAVQLIGQLERIPCFLSSCDSAPPIQQ